MNKTVTINEAYKAMYLYLENLYEMTGSDDLAGFLGSMSMMGDGRPVDDAVWGDWLKAIEKARMNPNIDFKLKES